MTLLAQQQQPSKVKYDTIKVAGKSVIFLKDSSIYVEKDTILIVEDSIARLYQRDTLSAKDKKIMDTLKSKVSKKTFLKKIINPIVRWPDEQKNKPQDYGTQLSVAAFEKYEGRLIDTIIVKQLDVFGTDINDTTKQDTAWLKRTANHLHINTQSRVVLNNLLFKKGETINPHELADSERLLRLLPFIKDARIIVEASERKSDPVKVIVITKDIWSIIVSGSLRRFEAASLTVTDKNFLGLGHSLRNKLIVDSRYKPAFGFESAYRISNFRNTFINGEIFIARTEEHDRTGFQFQRDFITPDIRYAGGIEFTKERLFREPIVEDTVMQRIALSFRHYDAWFGRSILLNSLAGRSNLTFAMRVSHLHHFDRPVVSVDSNRIYTNATAVLASVSLTRRLYHTSHLVNGYGITEDIPSGYKVTLTFGKEFNEFSVRDYLSMSTANGGYIGRYGYLRGELSLGGFFNGETFEQGLVKAKFNYFSHLFRIKKYYIRQFFNLEIAKGLAHHDEDIINISDEYGIRGISNRELIGNQKITLNAETVAFSPYYFLGFRFAFFVFADLGMVSNDQSFLKGKLYQGYGFGIRLRNENLTFTTFQIRFGFYPVAPLGIANFQVDFDEKPQLYIEDFAPEAPSILRITPED